MFGRRAKRRNGRLLSLLGAAIAGGVAVVTIVPAIRRRALRATTILRKDHRVVSGLLWTLRHTANASVRKSIFNQIKTNLDIHTQVEEEIFYPAVRNTFTTIAENLVNGANREHEQIKDLCHQISVMDSNSYEFMSKVNELEEKIEHHVEQEEADMFRVAERSLSSTELDHLGRRIHDRKLRLKERIAA
jgi:hemerythrin-like domain-containing protein